MKAALTLATIGLILITTVASVDAQDYYELYKPTMSGPNINVTAPKNASVIQSDSLQLIFTVTKPEIVEFSTNISPDIIENNGVRNSSGIMRVHYKGDWQTEETILYSNQDGDIGFLEFNETIVDIPDGRHQVEITAVGSVDLIVAMFGFTYQNNANTTIVFTDNSNEPPLTPFLHEDRNAPHVEWMDYLLPVSVIVAFIVVLSVLLLRRHRKTSKKKQ